MEKLKSVNPEERRGKGYIIGAIIGIIAAITAFVFTENIAISIPLFAGLSIPIGISIEQDLQAEDKEAEARKMRVTISLIGTGILFFILIILVKVLI
jgi:dipeptide/tripeptide permease